MGTADAGHYISYININRKSPENPLDPKWLKTEDDKWLEFNDSYVREYKYSDLEEDCFGGMQNVVMGPQVSSSSGDLRDYSKNAYMLIYEKRVKEKLKVVIPSDIMANYQELVDQANINNF